MNEFGLRGLNPIELNLFYALLHLIKDKGDGPFKFEEKEIRQLSKFNEGGKRTSKDFKNHMIGMRNKLRKINIEVEGGEDVKFDLFKFSYKDGVVTVRVTPYFVPWFNNVEKNFTRIELNKIISLKTRYSKEMYRFLMQYPKNCLWIVTMTDFRRLLCVPDSYEMRNIYQQIINPTIKNVEKEYEEGKQVLKSLRIAEKKKSRMNNKEITGFHFKYEKPSVSPVKDAGSKVVAGRKPTELSLRFKNFFEMSEEEFAAYLAEKDSEDVASEKNPQNEKEVSKENEKAKKYTKKAQDIVDQFGEENALEYIFDLYLEDDEPRYIED